MRLGVDCQIAVFFVGNTFTIDKHIACAYNFINALTIDAYRLNVKKVIRVCKAKSWVKDS